MRKKSARKACEAFKAKVDKVRAFVEATNKLGDEHVSWCHEQAIIQLYRSFEKLMLDCLICAINNDTKQISHTTGINFPKHLTDEVCEYIITGARYFDFRGKDGLIKTLKRFIKNDHYLLKTISDRKWRDALERLSALRNFAAHDSMPAKKAALKATGHKRIGSAGSWLKRQNRLTDLCTKFYDLADAIRAGAPY